MGRRNQNVTCCIDGRVSICSIGILTELKNTGPSKGRQVEVDFPEDHDWSALYDELERIPPDPLKVSLTLIL